MSPKAYLPVLPQFQNHHLTGRCVAPIGHGINWNQNVGLREIGRGAAQRNVEADDDEFACNPLHTAVEIV